MPEIVLKSIDFGLQIDIIFLHTALSFIVWTSVLLEFHHHWCLSSHGGHVVLWLECDLHKLDLNDHHDKFDDVPQSQSECLVGCSSDCLRVHTRYHFAQGGRPFGLLTLIISDLTHVEHFHLHFVCTFEFLEGVPNRKRVRLILERLHFVGTLAWTGTHLRVGLLFALILSSRVQPVFQ